MKYNGFIVFVLGFVLNACRGQISLNGCLSGWVSNGDRCYLFVFNSPQILEEADSQCWTYGAKLLVINSYAEHVFIKSWLTNNDILFHSTWFTGGFYVNNAVVWDTTEVIGDLGDLWVVKPQTTSRIYNRLAYKLIDSEHGYGWSLVSGSSPSNFICEMTKEDVRLFTSRRDYDYGVLSVDKTKLPHGPQMTTEPSNVLVLAEGGPSIYVECAATSLPQSKYSWKRGNTTLESTTDKRYTLSGGRLTIESPTERLDSGYYQCSAENEIGTILSSIAQITFGYLHAFSPVKPNDQIGTAFEGVRVSCNTPAYKPAVRYGWFKNHNTHNYIFPGHPVHFISQSGYLYFSEVQYTDDRVYYCVVTLVTTAGFVTDTSMAPSRVGLGTKLIIRDGKTDNSYGPIIYTHTFPTPALKGSQVRLECVAYSSQPENLIYTWHRENGQPMIKGTTLSDRNRVLEIPYAPMEAQGNYICTVRRPATSSTPGDTKSSVITLMLETSPYFADPIGNQLVDPNQNVIWRCKAVARPAATYAWYKNGQLIVNVPGKLEAVGNILKITKVTKAEEGMYQCSATNQHGTSFSSGELKILSFKPNFDRYPIKDSHLAALGGNITIPCKAEGAPVSEIQWLKNGGVLSLTPGLVNDRIGMTLAFDLVITLVQQSDQGTYTCKATNVNGEATNSTVLSVVQGVVITTAPSPTTVTLNRTEFLFCSASHSNDYLDVNYLWFFNGHLINFKNNPHLIKGTRNNLLGLYIREAQYSNSGKYTCNVRTPLHSDSRSAIVSVHGPPGEPAGVYVDSDSVTSHSARVIWTWGFGSDHGSPVLSYDIEADTNFDPENWKIILSDAMEFDTVKLATESGHRGDQRAAVVKNLVPNTSYRFRVRAVNEYGRGTEASRPSVMTKTPSTAPYRAPSGLGGGDGSEGTLNISWTPLPASEQCAPGIGYVVYWRKQGDKRDSWNTNKVYNNEGKFTATIGVENYYLPYEVKVHAFNDIGDGPNTTVAVVYSAMGIPSIVPTITDVSGINISTVVVTWDPIPDDREHIKGRVGGYTIQYYWNDQGCNPMTGCEVTNIRTRNIWGQTTEVMLIDLEANSEFFFRVQVFNSAGRGPKGEWRRGETANNPPLNYPRFVTVLSHGPHSVLVRWQGVMTSTNEEIITGYKVKWWEVQSDIRNANETMSDSLINSLVVYGLQSKTIYQLRVQGVSSGGDGQMSNSVFFTLEGGMVRIDPSTTEFCYEAVTCSSAVTIQRSQIKLTLIMILTCFVFYLCIDIFKIKH